jgi:hypothetical protein
MRDAKPNTSKIIIHHSKKNLTVAVPEYKPLNTTKSPEGSL